MRVPDLAVTCAPPDNDLAVVALPEPVFIAEILSPGNPQDAWLNVWTYTLIPTVQEILVLYSSRARADILRRRPDGIWPEAPLTLIQGGLILESIGLEVPLQDLYRTTALGV